MRGLIQLAKIRNAKVEDLQRRLRRVLDDLAQKEAALKTLQNEMSAVAAPMAGSFGDLINFEENRATYRREIKAAQKEIFTAHQQAFQARFFLKRALSEYEKVNSVVREEKAAIALSAKKSEEKRLDDAAINARYMLRGER
ncbi:MAG: flagellar FliJ family protein [Helicobacteraceae bacterium]|jgi:predicted  nucleic acid-binding Zn-ribbon protein|nr:flagellar FliJ family protein [Helicobacteraceae bacterium]